MVETKPQEIVIGPQPGPQEQFLSTSADICIFGGAAGGGKSYGLLLEALRYIDNPEFSAVIFRRTYPEIMNEGGLWDESVLIYPLVGGQLSEGPPQWTFPSGATIRFAHMQHEKDKYSWQGSQIPLIGFDEVTLFTKAQFFYMLSRNRSTCGVKPYMRATCNPDADSWVKIFIAPWVHEDWPEDDRAHSGEIRWFVIDGDELVWLPKDGTYPNEQYPYAKSVTFIEADIYDNPKLLEKDPGYLANLHALPLVERERLLHKNWRIRVEGGNKFKKHWFPLLDSIPDDIEKTVRYWDFAATEEVPTNSQRDGPDYTASVKMGRRKAGAFPRYIILDATWDRLSPGKVEEKVREIAELDGEACDVWFEEEPGSAGKFNTFSMKTRVLEGFSAHGIRSTGSKEVRANTFSSQAEAGNVALLKAWWNHGYLGFLEPFPSPKVHDDPVDAGSGAMEQLFQRRPGVYDLNQPTEEEKRQAEEEAKKPVNVFAWAAEHEVGGGWE
jgi:predicted phage terminase large subunit-like protein